MSCLWSKTLPYKLQYNRNFVEGSPQANDEISSHSGVGFREPDRSFRNPLFVPPNEGYYRPIHLQDFYVWSAFHANAQMAQKNPFYALESHFYPTNHEHNFPVYDRYEPVPFRMSSQGYQPGFQFQEFQYFVVIDFEATCDKEKYPHPQEIIEFPSVIVNSMTGQLQDCFQIYVRPTCNQLLSDFCKELTGIQQAQVDKGVLLSEALLLHDKWLEGKGIKHTNFAVVTWSNWDCQVMLESECRLKRIRKPPYFNRWINLRVPFHEVFGAVKCNLKEAVQLAGLVWEGRAHCGLDDAKNTARLLANLMHRGLRFAITDSLMWQSANFQFPMQLDHQSGVPQPSLRIKHPSMPFIQRHPSQIDPNKERGVFCHCGVKSSKQMIQKPEPKHGSCFFVCGNWTTTRGARCSYFEWATPDSK